MVWICEICRRARLGGKQSSRRNAANALRATSGFIPGNAGPHLTQRAVRLWDTVRVILIFAKRAMDKVNNAAAVPLYPKSTLSAPACVLRAEADKPGILATRSQR